MKKKIIFLLIIISIFSLTGCSYKEINNLALVSAVGIDYEDNKYKVSAQVMDLQKESNDTTKESAVLYEGEGKTLLDAFKNINLQYPNTLYLGHLELLILGPGVIENGLNDIFDFFLREPQTRTDCLLIVSTENKAKEIVDPKIENKNGTFPSKDLITTIENSEKINGYVTAQTLEDFILDYYHEGKDQVATNITVSNEETDIKTELTTLAVFDKNKYKGTLTKEESLAYNIIKNDYVRGNLDVIFKEEITNVSLKPSSKIKVKIENNKVIFDIIVKANATITETNSKMNFTTSKDFDELTKLSNENLTKKIEDLISFSKENNIDILGLNNEIYKHYYKEYENYKDKNIYEIAKINVKVDVHIYKYGNISKTLGGADE